MNNKELTSSRTSPLNATADFAFESLLPVKYQGLNLPKKSNKVLAVNKIIERQSAQANSVIYMSERVLADARFDEQLWNEKCARIKRALRIFANKKTRCIAPANTHFINVYNCNKAYGFRNTSNQCTIRFEDNIRKSLISFGYDVQKYWYSFQGKPLNIERTFGDYNISNGCDLYAHLRVRGGMPQPTIFGNLLKREARPTVPVRRALERSALRQFANTSDNYIFVNFVSNRTRFAATRTQRTILVHLDAIIGAEIAKHNLNSGDVWYLYQTKPLRLHCSFRDYNMQSGNTVYINHRIRGGANLVGQPIIPPYTHVQECERDVLLSTMRFKLQSNMISGNTEDISQFIKRCMDSINKIAGDEQWLANTFENFFHIIYWLRKCTSYQDYAVNTALAYKLLTGHSAVCDMWNAFRGTELQADAFTEAIEKARDIFTVTKGVLEDPLVDRIRKVYTYLLVQGVFSKLGLNMEIDEFQKLDHKCRSMLSDDKSMLLNIVEVAITICERFNNWRLTGDWTDVTHSGAAYDKWYKQADRLIALAPFTSNLQAHGTTYFSFISDLRDTIERGDSIAKYNMASNGIEINSMRKKLQSLKLLQNVEVTRRAAQKERRAPFGVLVHGGSSVGKSTFTKLLYYYYGRLHDLDVADHFRYVRNPADEYWSNFDSSKWCVQLDDIAYLLASKVPEADPTLKEIICLINNVPYVPPQAALEDKGKTPVLAELVIATTNTPDLNAQDYFSCPLAVRRRLPFIIKIEPKKQYMSNNGKFIDPEKLPPLEQGFPDYWDITLQKLVPCEYYGRDSAKLETVKKFSNISEFLQVYATASLKHKSIQTKSDTCDKGMRDVKVCKLCYNIGNQCDCLQSQFILVDYFFMYVINFFLHWFCSFMCLYFMHWVYRFRINRYIMIYLISFLPANLQRKFAGIINTVTDPSFGRKLQKVVAIGAFLINTLACYKILNYVADVRKTRHRKKLEAHIDAGNEYKPEWCIYNACDYDEHHQRVHQKMIAQRELAAMSAEDERHEQFELNGNVFGSTEEQLLKEESKNIWYTPTVELCRFDVPNASQSQGQMLPAEIRDLFTANCVRLWIEACDGLHKCRTGAVYLRGQYVVFNRHALKDFQRFNITLISGSTAEGLTPNLKFYLERAELSELPEHDLVVMCVKNAPPRKDILKYWNDKQIPVTNMVSVMRTNSGDVTYTELFNVIYKDGFPIERLDREMSLYMGKGNREAQVGDCGSLGVASTPIGPIILGLHTIGYQTTVGFPHVTKSRLMQCLDANNVSYIEGGGKPAFTLQSDVTLQPPHHKSIFRYISEGVANFYGSIPGFIARGKTKVCATPFKEEVLEHFEIPLQHAAPVLNGWEPWRKNVVEMVKPNCSINQRLLDQCTKEFTNDILKGLQEKHGDNWKKELVFLSDMAAVNGLPGVKFVDAINKNSSMGAPWNKPKKHFLRASPSERYPDGVDFTPEVWERVRKIEKKYCEKKRANPVYTAHLKDEAVTKEKAADKKTRMFTGAPVDFSIVMRKYLLSFIRLVQLNTYIFEACPGVVCQSAEWSKIYTYLTFFGVQQMVAGDYSKFDKHMIATIILSAFEVVANIFLAAGFSIEEVSKIMCLALDVAFPIVNCRGDIVMFDGTNPSGHPFTVIINSFVNSLYMRYAFATLNPSGPSCSKFREFVRLLTYGDDNIMGVSKEIPWFNHTAIQKALSIIGVTYTMADKESESVPYVHIRDCAFLKRSWRWDEEVQAYLCPLDVDSIYKSLTMWVASGTIDKYKQMVDVITAANNEFFFHGREEFNKHHAFFCELLQREPYNLYVTETTLLSWDALHERFKRASL